MRRYSAFLLTLLMSLPVWANDPPSKPIKPAAHGEEASAPPRRSREPKETKEAKEGKESKESKGGKEAKDSRESKESKDAKEALAADELAAKIAERLAILRKDKEVALRPASRPAVHNPVMPKKPEAKPAHEPHGAAAIVAAMGGHGAVHWAYQGDGGPLNWGKLSPENAKCEKGERQSPIDIRDGIRVDLDPITFDYKPSGFNVIDNGHTVQVNVGAGNYITVMGKNYELVQFHFHKPSEERVYGRAFEMVAHLVHKDPDGRLAVVAVLMDRGRAHSLIQLVWSNLPLEKHEPLQALTSIDMNQILPIKREYYTYMGSLTTPPCSEGVLWMVMKEPIEISPAQLAIFGRLYPMNARPIQKVSGRLIKESN